MRIEAVEVKNGCQHRQFKSQLGPGVIVIEGPNGAGKSNLIKLIVRGLTGLNMNPGKKEEDLTYGETQGHVKVDFSVGGQNGTIQRNLKSAQCKMTFGGRDYKTAKEIDEAIFNILGISPKVMSEVIMAQQGKIESILFQAPADRARSMQELFGTLQAEKLRDILGEDLANTPIASRADTIKQLEDSLKANIEGPIEAAFIALRGATEKTLSKDDISRLEEVVRAYEVQKANKTALDMAVSEEEKCSSALTGHDVKLAALTSAYDQNLPVINDLRPLVETLNEKIRSAGEKKLMKAQRDEALKQLDDYTRDLELPEPKIGDLAAGGVKMLSAEQMEAQRGMLNKLRMQADNLRGMLQSLSGKATCPTCHQPVSEGLKAQHHAELSELQNQLLVIEPAVAQLEAAFREYTVKHSQWVVVTGKARTLHAQLQEKLFKLPEVVVPSDAELADDRRTVDEFNSLERTQSGLQSDIANMKAFRSTLVEQFDKARERRKAAEQCQAAAGDPALYNNARSLLDTHNKASLEVASLEGKIEALKSQHKTVSEQIAKLKYEEDKLAKVKEWRELVEKARQYLHRDQLPNLVAQSYIRAINGRLAKYLEMFEVPYTCKIAADLGVICAFSGGRQLPAERLSGGEKVMLGIAFRFAIYDLFASNLGLLILDEPTVFLDDDRIDSVYMLLEKAKSYSKSAGLQLIVITHEKRLTGVADRVISL